jgi:hypothetical protein
VLLHRTTSRFANFSSAGRQSTMNSSSRVFRQCLRVRVGVIRAVSAAAVCTFVTGASAQACGARVGPGIASLPSPSESGVADGNAGPGPPSIMTLEACRLRVRLGCHCQCEGACWGAAASTAHAYGRAAAPGPMLQGAGEAACTGKRAPRRALRLRGQQRVPCTNRKSESGTQGGYKVARGL